MAPTLATPPPLPAPARPLQPIDVARPPVLPTVAAEPPFAQREGAAPQQHRFDAFISYRHVEPDRRWAKWLHTALETYRLPGALARARGLPPRLGRVFRDEEELPASADLKEEIEQALRQSHFLIVVCSPRTPESLWVNREVERFRELGRHDRILALLIEGEPGEAFPTALREIRRTVVDARGMTRQRIEEVEPLAADVRVKAGERHGRRARMRMAKLRILACLLGVRFDDLRQREQQRRTRRQAMLGTVVLLLAVALSGLGAAAIKQSRRAAKLVEGTARAREDARRAEEARQLALARADAANAKAKAEQALAAAAAKAEQAQRRVAGENGYLSQIALADREMAAGNLSRANEILDACPVEFRNWEWRYLKHQCNLDRLTIGIIGDVTPSADGTLLPVGIRGERGLETLNVLNVQTGQLTPIPTPPGYHRCIALSPDGRRLALQRADENAMKRGVPHALEIWDVPAQRLLATHQEHQEPINALCFSPDGQRLASLGEDHTILVTDVGTASVIRRFEGGRQNVAFSPDGSMLWSDDKVWDVETATLRVTLASGTDQAAFIPGGTTLLSCGLSTEFQFWSLKDGKPSTLPTPIRHYGMALSPDGNLFASAAGNQLEIWDRATQKRLSSIQTRDTSRPRFYWASDGKTLLSCRSYQMQFFDVQSLLPRLPETIEVVPPTITGSSFGSGLGDGFSPRGRWVAAPSRNKASEWTLRVADVAQREDRATILPGRVHVHCWAISSDGARVAAAMVNYDVTVWDVATGRVVCTMTNVTPQVRQLTFSPDGRWLTGTSERGGLHFWEMPSGKKAFTLDGGTCMAFSPNGKLLASASEDYHYQTLKVWDVASRTVLRSMRLDMYLTAVTFSHDGQRIAAGSGDRMVRVFNAADGTLISTCASGASTVNSVAFTPDGTRLAAGSERGEITLIDPATGREVLTLRLHTGAVRGIAFSEDGNTLVSLASEFRVAQAPAFVRPAIEATYGRFWERTPSTAKPPAKP